jgi:hypothetical protein
MLSSCAIHPRIYDTKLDPVFWNSLKTFEETPASVIVKWTSEKPMLELARR